MTAIMNKRMERSKLLAAFAVLAIVVCAFAAVIPATDAAANGSHYDVDTPGAGAVEVTDFASLQTALSDASASEEDVEIVVLPTKTVEGESVNASFAITQNITIPENVTLFIGNVYGTNGTNSAEDSTKVVADANTFRITVNDGVTVTVQGDVFNNLGKNKDTASIVVNGTITFDGGLLYSVGALSFGENGKILDAFFTNSNGNSKASAGTMQYKHMYSSNIDAIAPYVNAVDYNDTEEDSEVSAIYSYGDVSVGKITSDISDKTIIVGGVNGSNVATVTFTEDANIFPDALQVKIGSEAVNNGNVTLSDANIAGTYTNNGTTTINGTVSGTINNENGTVSITTYTEPESGAGLTVSGGDLSAADGAKLPVLEGGVVFERGTITYNTYTFTTIQGVSVTVGIPAITYSPEMDYGGGYVNAVPLTYTIDSKTTTVDVNGWNAFPGYNLLYNDYDNAKANNGEYGECINAADTYWVNVGLNVITDSAYGPIAVTFLANVSIDPIEVDVSIVGNGANGALADKNFTGEQIKPIAGTNLNDDGVDFIVQAVIDGETVTLSTNDYDITYGPNTDVGEAAGTVTVTLKGNYGGTDEATFDIVQGLASISATLTDETQKNYVGQIIDKNDFTFVGTYENGDPTGTDDAPSIDNVTIVGSQYYSESGTYTITFNYDDNGNVLECTCDVTVIGIESITADDVSEGDTYKDVYNAGESFDSNGMKLTVTYSDGAFAVFNNASEAADAEDAGFVLDTTTAENKLTEGLSADFTFGYGIFNDAVGDDITVSVTYFDFADEFIVTVNGNVIIYMLGEEQIASQAGVAPAQAAVFNYVWAVPSGQSFTGWRLENTGSVYQPGDMIGYGENTDMWGDDGTIYLYAQFEDGGSQVPTEASENILITIVYTENGATVYLTGLDGGYIPETTVTIKYTFTYYDDFFGAYATESRETQITISSDSNVGYAFSDLSNYEHYLDITYVQAYFGENISQEIVYEPATLA